LACLEKGRVTRRELIDEFLNRGEAEDASQAGRFVSLISQQLGMEKNDFLRQVVGYEYPEHHWEKDNYHIRDGYDRLVAELLADATPQQSTSG
jgi:hypothetical protein